MIACRDLATPVGSVRVASVRGRSTDDLDPPRDLAMAPMKRQMSRAAHREGVRTHGQRSGDAAESLVADRLSAAGWHVLARQLHVGRAEIDILAIDPGPPLTLVVVEVRWRARRDYGLAEETVDRRKLRRLRSAAWMLRERAALPDGAAIPRLATRIDLVAVEPGGSGGSARVRHHRAVG